jgi:hypothetical protein
VGDFKVSMGSSSLSMYNSLGDPLSVEMCQFIDEVEVRDDDGAIGSSSD